MTPIVVTLPKYDGEPDYIDRTLTITTEEELTAVMWLLLAEMREDEAA